MRYVLGLDIGIQSVGWAVVRMDEPARIEDFGVRIFDSTENAHEKNNANQERRLFRAARRVIRRRSHRKAMIKAHLQKIGLLNPGEVEALFENGALDILELRVRGLTQCLSPAELAACLINMANHRGYREFYSLDDEEQKQLTAQEKKEYQQERNGIERVKEIMENGHYRSVADMLLKAPEFSPQTGKVRVYRSHPYKDILYPISRDLIRKEAEDILSCQAEYYPVLNQPYNTLWKKESVTTSNREFLLWLIFEQRDFEDGPGDAENPFRKYTGFLTSLGNCQFYKDQPRAARMTILGDVFSVTNALSQYRYINNQTGEMELPGKMARELVQKLLEDGELPQKKIKEIAKKYGIIVDDKDTKAAQKAPSCVKFMRRVKPVLEQNGLDWKSALGKDPFDPDTLLNKIGRILSLYQTPARRKKELLGLPGMTKELAGRLTAMQNLSGTAKVCERYMREAVEAFENGERYGEFQWRKINELENVLSDEAKGKNIKLPPFTHQAEFAKNSVVFRSLNETRKIINAIVEEYGSPWAVNLEVASELGRSWSERGEIEKQNKQNQKKAQQDREKICQIMGWSAPDNVSGAMLERFRLGEQQGWQCLYTGKPILDKCAAVDPKNKQYEVDHIVPFSLILDNSLNNKALVLMDENQAKGQRTPLMYMRSAEQKNGYITRVNAMAQKHLISDRKRQYLLLADLKDSNLLNEWKTRNLNDTRYIAKYLKGYLERELAPAQVHRTPFVFPVKGGLTSRFRRIWLDSKTWGENEKEKLRGKTTLHHAVDAVVIANLTPATAQIAEDNFRLNRIWKAGHGETPEYSAMLEKSIDTLEKYYHIPRDKAEAYLRRKNRIVAPVSQLNLEVNLRFGMPDETIDPDTYSRNLVSFYHYDPDFANSLVPPLTSRKQERKVQGTLTAGNPLGTKRVEDQLYERKRLNVLELTQSKLLKMVTGDEDLRCSLEALLGTAKNPLDKENGGGKQKEITLGEILTAQGLSEFRTRKGKLIRKVTLQNTAPLDTVKVKEIAPGNQSVLKTANYYCVEVYKNTQGETKVRGISRTDLVRKDKKLYLTCPYPQDYAQHEMYLFKNDYITVETKNGLMFEGYYQSPSGIKQAKFNGISANAASISAFRITSTAVVKKYDVSILGRKGGQISCGEPLLFLAGKK